MVMTGEDGRRRLGVIELECGHVISPFSFTRENNEDDPYLCRRCPSGDGGGVYRLKKGVVYEYRWWCADCGGKKRYGQAKLNAELGAVRHRNHGKGKGHAVTVMYGPNAIHVFDNRRQMALLPDNEEPPF